MEEKQIVTLLPIEVFRKLKILASTKLITIKSLMLEALQDLFIKHGV